LSYSSSFELEVSFIYPNCTLLFYICSFLF
jgi:hypothetical protein